MFQLNKRNSESSRSSSKAKTQMLAAVCRNTILSCYFCTLLKIFTFPKESQNFRKLPKAHSKWDKAFRINTTECHPAVLIQNTSSLCLCSWIELLGAFLATNGKMKKFGGVQKNFKAPKAFFKNIDNAIRCFELTEQYPNKAALLRLTKMNH